MSEDKNNEIFKQAEKMDKILSIKPNISYEEFIECQKRAISLYESIKDYKYSIRDNLKEVKMWLNKKIESEEAFRKMLSKEGIREDFKKTLELENTTLEEAEEEYNSIAERCKKIKYYEYLIIIYKRLIKIEYDDIKRHEIYTKLADIYVDLGDIDEAIEVLFKDAETDREHTAEYILSALEEIQYLGEEYEKYEEAGEASEQLASWLFESDDEYVIEAYQDALRYYKLAGDKESQSYTYNELGWFLEEIDPEKALNSYKKARDLNPKYSENKKIEELTEELKNE